MKDRYYNMIRRCYDIKDISYKNYGARGITVCDEWLESRDAFIAWALAAGFEDHLTLDRIDNESDYSPDNCRWSTYEEQARNRRDNVTNWEKGTRICRVCDTEKPLTEFGKDTARGNFGHRYQCKECRRKYDREYMRKWRKKTENLLKSVKDGFRRRFNWSQMQPSEAAAEQYFTEQGWKFERFGWDRTKIRTRGLPEKYRFIPDYLVDKGKGNYALYECKGMSSRGGLLRLKVSMYEVLEEHYTADLELRILAYALPSEELYDVPFSVFKESRDKEPRIEEAHDGAVFFVFPLRLFEEWEVKDA